MTDHSDVKLLEIERIKKADAILSENEIAPDPVSMEKKK